MKHNAFLWIHYGGVVLNHFLLFTYMNERVKWSVQQHV
jgi:hypothetical protein